MCSPRLLERDDITDYVRRTKRYTVYYKPTQTAVVELTVDIVHCCIPLGPRDVIHDTYHTFSNTRELVKVKPI